MLIPGREFSSRGSSFAAECALSDDGQFLATVHPQARRILIRKTSELDAHPQEIVLDCEPIAVASILTPDFGHLWCVGARNARSGSPLALVGAPETGQPNPAWEVLDEPTFDGKLLGAEVWTVVGHKDRFIALGGRADHGNFMLEVSVQKEHSLTPMAIDGAPCGIAFEPSNEHILYVTTGAGGTVEVWDRLEQKRVDTLRPEKSFIFKPTHIRHRVGSNRFWVSSYNLLLWFDLENSWSSPLEVTGNDDCVNDFDITADGRICAACTYTNRVAMIEMGKITYQEMADPWLVKTHKNRAYVLRQDHRNQAIVLLKR